MVKKFIQLSIAALFTLASAAHADVAPSGAALTFGGHQYTLLTSDTWANSEAYATQHHGHLVAINSAAENTFLNTSFGGKLLWIGLARTGADTFGWSNGDALTYTNWAAGEPNNWQGNENVVHTYASGQWNDLADGSGMFGAKYGVMEVSAVPEANEYAMLIAGLGLLGVFARRRKAGK
ncbi:hypothetical protein AAKU55_001187 [Oxalobacteraceae bacterium GrIS 1.11]